MQMPVEARRGCQAPGAEVMNTCELLSLGAGNGTHSEPLHHLSNTNFCIFDMRSDNVLGNIS